MIWYILRPAGFREVISVFSVLFTESCIGTEEQCRGNILQLLIRKPELGSMKPFLGMTP